AHSPLPHHSLFSLSRATRPPSLYPLSLHDALPILFQRVARAIAEVAVTRQADARSPSGTRTTFDIVLQRLPLALVPAADLLFARSEEHTSELQSLTNLVCRLLLEKKNTPTHTRSAH